MDPIITALVAGAAAALKDAASDTVKNTYHALRNALQTKVESLADLEENPENKAHQKTTSIELRRHGLDQEPDVREMAAALISALEREPPNKLIRAGIDIRDIHAAGDMLIRNVKAAGRIEISGVVAGEVEKNA